MNINKLKGLMRENNKTQEDTAAAIYISFTSFKNKLRGKADFKSEETKRLAELFNVEISVLYK